MDFTSLQISVMDSLLTITNSVEMAHQCVLDRNVSNTGTYLFYFFDNERREKLACVGAAWSEQFFSLFSR